MSKGVDSIFLKVKDISEWQKLCSSYNFHEQEEYKLDWWLEVIEEVCYRKKSLTIDISSLKSDIQEELRQWPIEVLCLKNIFKGLINKKKLVSLKSISRCVAKSWENALENEKERTQTKHLKIGLGWIRSAIGIFLKKDAFFLDESNEQVLETDIYVCINLVDKIANKLVSDINRGLLGSISKKMGKDELLILYNKFNDHIEEVVDMIYDIPRNTLNEIILWYFMIFSPGEWVLKSFVVSGGIGSHINAIKLRRTYSSNRKDIEITETDIADIILQITEEDIQKSISNLEEKFLFHDSKCKEYALSDQKQLAINHLKQKYQIEKALNEVNQQLLILSQSRVTLDTSTAKVSLLNALETSSNATKYIMNENEILKKLDDISQIREEVEITQESINSMIKSSANEITGGEKVYEELERELDELLRRAKITSSDPEVNIQQFQSGSKEKEAEILKENFIST